MKSKSTRRSNTRNRTRRRPNLRRPRRLKFNNRSNNTTRIMRTCEKNFSTTANVDAYGSLVFKLSDLPGVRGFTSVFDQYMLSTVRVKVIPETNVAYPSLTLPAWGVVLDYDDEKVPTSWNYLMSYSSFKSYGGGQTWTKTISPMVESTVYNTAVASAYAPKRKVWLDCAYPDVPHFGIKYGIHSGTAAVNYVLDCQYTILFRFSR